MSANNIPIVTSKMNIDDVKQNKFQSRKFVYALMLSGCSTIALATNRTTMRDWCDMNKFLFASYVAGNVVQKYDHLR